MSAEGVERPGPEWTRHHERLDKLLIGLLGSASLGRVSADRLLGLNQALGNSILSPTVVDLIPDTELPDLPIVQALRTMEDFSPDEEVRLKFEGSNGFQRFTVVSKYPRYLEIQSTKLMLQFVMPSYVGLFSLGEYQYYKNDHPGAGGGKNRKPKAIHANTELTEHLLTLGVGAPAHHTIFQGVPRHFTEDTPGQRPNHPPKTAGRQKRRNHQKNK